MSSLLVRNVEPELVERLKQQARRHGRSVEAEHREILRSALSRGRTGRDLLKLIRSGPGLGLEVGDVRRDDTGRAAEFTDE